MMKGKINKLVIPSVILGVAMIFGCNAAENEANETSTEEAQITLQTVEVVSPGHESFVSTISISGIAKPNRMVEVHAMESGLIKTMRRDIGDHVKRGDVLAILENPELNRLFQSLTAQLKAKKKNYDRLKATYEETPAITPLKFVEEAEADYLTAEAELAGVLDRIGFLEVVAPFSGVVSQRFMDEGALVQNAMSESGASALFEVQQYDPVRVSVPLPETDASAITAGMNAIISFPQIPGSSFTLPVSRISGAIDPKSGTMQVEIDVPNSEKAIKPGMYAKVKIEIANRQGVLTLPVQAQFINQDSPWILVVENGVVKKIALEKGLSDRSYFEVLNDGITESSLVIVQGKSLVSEGQQVEAIKLKSE